MNINKTITTLFLVLFVMVLLMSFYTLWFVDEGEKLETVKLSLENCKAQKQACSVEIGKIKTRISFDNNIYYLKPFNVSVWTENESSHNIESIEIDFKMNNMNMGLNHFQLTQITSENNIMRWQGKALLPICVAGRADWFSELEIVTNGKKYILTIPLVVKRSSH